MGSRKKRQKSMRRKDIRKGREQEEQIEEEERMERKSKSVISHLFSSQALLCTTETPSRAFPLVE